MKDTPPLTPHSRLLAVAWTGVAFAGTLLGATPAATLAQSRATSVTMALALDDAVELAHATSEALAVARAGIAAASGRRAATGAGRLPSIAAYSSFDRALRSEFEGLSLGEPPPTDGEPIPDLPFGSPNTYRTGVTISQTIFSGGRTLNRARAAASAERAAVLALVSARARLTLEVAEAYFDAQLAEQLVHIARGTLAQAESTAERAGLVLRSGRASEFEHLRAKVARDRHLPVLIRQQAARDVALLRLKQLVHVAPAVDVTLTTELEPQPTVAAVRPVTLVAAAAHAAPPVARATDRALVRAAALQLRQREQLSAAARAARWPTVVLTSSYERVAYSRTGVPARQEFRTNWMAGARVEVPLFTGGQRAGTEAEAEADAAAARATLHRTYQLAELDARTAALQLSAADAAWAASEGGVSEASRAYDIAVLRHREGLAIQLELSDARLALEQARGERARAARDLLVERLRVALIADLPLTTTAAAGR